MTILRTNTISGIGTEGTVFEGDITIDSLNYMTLPKGTTNQRYSLEGRDPHYHKLKLHLPLVHHTQFDDYSPASPSITANYDSHISSKSGVFENSAALFSRQGSNDWLYYSDSTDNDLGSDDFTIECWFMCTDGGTNGYLVQKGTTSGNWSYFIQFREATDSINFYGTSDGTNFDIVNGTSFGTTILPNKWYHVAVCRSGNTFSYYINGIKGATTDTSSASFHNSNVDVRIPESGGFGATEDVFLQDVRFYKGVAKYSETFTPQKLAEDGAIRYNTDSNKIECYNGTKWMNVAVSSPDLGGNGGPSGDPTGNSADQSSGARAIFAGMTPNASTATDAMDYITISTAGDAIDFGNLVGGARLGCGGCGSRTRGLFMGGQNSAVIDYVTIASTGNSVSFGNLTDNSAYQKSLSNQTRGVNSGGWQPSLSDVIDYVTIASTGDAKDFGNLSNDGYGTNNTGGGPAGGASPTRGVFCGGYINPGTLTSLNVMQYITIASTGNAQNFGDMSVSRSHCGQVTSSTRSVLAMGYNQPTNGNYNNMQTSEYFTFATLGNGVNFGDTIASGISPAGVSDCIRGVWAGGGTGKMIQYVNIATQGDTVDFGDMVTAGGWFDGCSSGHGGL